MKPARLGFVPVAVLLLALVAIRSNANEDTKSNPYESIAARNPFQLKDPPPPPGPDDVPKPPPPPLATVEVTGVLSLGKNAKKKALLEIVPGPGKPPLKPTLEEGERVESVEVLFIDVDEGFVKINNGGVITNVALKTPTKTPTQPIPLPGVQPGFPPPVLQPTAGIVPPTVNPNLANPNASQYNNNGRGNVMVVGGSPAAATPTAANPIAKPYGAYGAGATPPGNTATYGSPLYNPNTGAPGAGVPGGSGVNVTGGSGDLPPRTIPTRTIRTQTSGPPDPTQNDPAAQYLNMAIQKQQMEARGRPMPPLPPIPGFDPNQ